MSAINDALRRASSAAKTAPQTPSSPLPPMSAAVATPPWAEPTPAPSSAPANVTPPPVIAPPLHSESMPPLHDAPEKKSSKLPLVLIVVFLFCIVGVGALYFFGKGRLIASAREKLQDRGERMTGNDYRSALVGGTKGGGQIANGAMRSNQPAEQAQSAVVLVTTQPALKPNPPVPLAAPIVATTPAPAPAAAPRAPVHFPPLRLQSIFYRPGSASVMINGKTLFVGDELGGVSIADIQASSVTLVLSGQTNILTLR